MKSVVSDNWAFKLVCFLKCTILLASNKAYDALLIN